MEQELIVETAHRELVSEAMGRAKRRLDSFLETEAARYEDGTNGYINGRLDIVIDVRVSHTPYKEEKR